MNSALLKKWTLLLLLLFFLLFPIASFAQSLSPDINQDGVFNIHDVVELINRWGPINDGNLADRNTDGLVNSFDFTSLSNQLSPSPSASPTPENTFYVSTSGGDSNTGSQQDPWRTIEHAVLQIPENSTLYVEPGFYPEWISVRRNNTTMIALGDVTLYSIFVRSDNNIVRGFTFSQSTVTDISQRVNWGVRVSGNNNLIENNDISNSDQDGIWFFGNNNVYRSNYIHDILATPYSATDPHADCFQSWGPVENTLFDGNICDHNRTSGSNQIVMVDQMNAPTRNYRFTNNVFIMHDSGYSPANFVRKDGQGEISNVEFYGNTFVNTQKGQAAINLRNITGVKIMNNVFVNYGTTFRSYIENSGSTELVVERNAWYQEDGSTPFGTYPGDIGIVDPKFVDYTNMNYRLLHDSPLIDAGASLPELTTDFDGTPRPQGSGYDIGAFEFVPNVDATVSIDLNTIIGTSNMQVGVTHMQESLDPWGDTASVERGKDLLRQGVTYQNQHIMGFGTSNPNPAPGEYNWSSLDRRVQLALDSGNEPVITLCCAPDWMKGGQPGETDWSKIEVAPLPEHHQDYAQLSSLVAQRYPEVTYFLVWNEMKGLWKSSINNWDYERYTDLYNKIWDEVKAVRPDAKIGGPYLKIEGSGAQHLGYPSAWYTDDPITTRNLVVIDYWLANKRGADFITIDRNIKKSTDPNTYPESDVIKLTYWFGDVVEQVKQRPGYNNEPIWYAEDYIWNHSNPEQPGEEFQAAALASMLYHEVISGTAVSLRWSPEEQQGKGYKQHLFSSTRSAGGGQPYPVYFVYKAIHDHFGPGTTLYEVTSSAQNLEVLASSTRSLIINKSPQPLKINFNNSIVDLKGYQVLLTDI